MGLFKLLRGSNELADAIAARDWTLVHKLVLDRPRRARIMYTAELRKNQPSLVYPLHHCLLHNPPYKVIRLLIKSYPAALHQNEPLEMQYPLHIACQYAVHNVQVLDTLLQASDDLAMVRDARGRLPLHQAILSGAPLTTIVALLGYCSYAAEQADNDGHYPLHLACKHESCSTEVISMLLYANSQAVLERSKEGKTPYQYALRGNSRDQKAILKLLQHEEKALSEFYIPEQPNTMLVKTRAITAKHPIKLLLPVS